MRKLLFISLLFGIILNSTGQIINLSPDSTLYDLHLLPPGGGGRQVAPDFFQGGIVWVEGTDTTQFDSIYTSGSALNFESDGFLFAIDSIGTSGLIAEWQAVVDQMSVPPTGDTIFWYDTVMQWLVDSGYYARMEVLYVATQSIEADSKINWITPGTFDITDPGTTNPTWTKYEGWTGDGASDYLSTNWTMADSTVVSMNDMTGGIYVRTSVQENDFIYGWNTSPDVADFYFRAYDSSNGWGNSKIHTTSDQLNTVGAAAQGFHMNTRRGATDVEMYRNGGSEDSEADASTTTEKGLECYLLSVQLTGGAASTFSSNQFSIFFIMDGITDNEAAGLTTIFEYIMDKLGKGIIP